MLVTERLQIFESHDFGTDETSLEIGVNRPRGLGRLESLANAPRLDFVRTGGEKVNQMDGRKRRLDDFGKHGLHALVLTPLLLLLLGHRLQFALDLARKRNDDAAAVRLHPLVNFDQKLILLALKIPTTEIHQVNDRFRGEQLVRVQVRDVRRVPVSHAVAHLLSVLEPREHFIHSLQFLLLLLGHRRARRARQSRVQFFLERSNEFNILLSQFTRDDLDVIHRIDPILDVNHVGVLEASHDVRDAIHRFNVRQERVPESRTRARSFHQSRDVDNLQKRLHHALRLVLLDQPIEAFVGDVDARRVGVDGAKREIFRGNRAVGERVVQRRFSDVWHADDAHLGRRRVVVSRRHSSFLSSSLSIIHSFIGVARAP